MRKAVSDLQPEAAGLLCYRLLDVVPIREEPQTGPARRRFIETKSPALLLSAANGGRLAVDGRSFELRSGSMFVCMSGCLVELTNYSGLSTELLMLEFNAFFPPDPDAAQRDDQRDPSKLPFPPFAQLSAADAGRLYGLIGAAWQAGLPSDRLRCEAALLELLSLALSCGEQQTERALEAARGQLELRYTGDVTIDELAAAAGLSRFHFMRQFKERYGKGVMEYRTALRLRDAKRLLTGRDGPPLGEIAERVGYTSESYFSSLFKKQTGVSPAVYQRNQKLRVAAYSWVNVGQVLPLKTIPYAAPTDQYWTAYYRERFSWEVEAPLSHQYEFNRNVLLRSRPDKIVGVGSFIPKEEQDRLREIASALFLNWEEDWRSHLRRVGGVFESRGRSRAMAGSIRARRRRGPRTARENCRRRRRARAQGRRTRSGSLRTTRGYPFCTTIWALPNPRAFGSQISHGRERSTSLRSTGWGRTGSSFTEAGIRARRRRGSVCRARRNGLICPPSGPAKFIGRRIAIISKRPSTNTPRSRSADCSARCAAGSKTAPDEA
ncbi:helix-turn-helix domain-containing protein [Cohnella rhizosphaerae]|uniref:AraC family transcriptional regulator n=1 Tax=Cohnella rhizosphaerae TaxID=1457232 RepID=A0A9X4QVA6_9BACL|nr:AraC family transcriptional regulator [Cohnella rhizosphaerae]MDG0812399.1 AraC family transcriptional regulator [Cohnella rhizosphaerae]